MATPLLALAAAVLVLGAASAPTDSVQTVQIPDAIVIANEQGAWTVRTRCRSGRGFTVGPGYISRLVSREGDVVVDDRRPRGTLNDPEFGGLGAFGWHHARGRVGRLRFGHRNAWEVSGRSCAASNHGFGVVSTSVAEAPRHDGDAVEFAVDVYFSDMFTHPRPLLKARYSYRFEPERVESWIEVTNLCGRGRCGRTRLRAFVKEPKIVAHVVGGAFSRMATFDAAGDLACVYVGGGGERGSILDTGQCSSDARSRLRFDYGTDRSGSAGGCELRRCLDVEVGAYDPRTADPAPTLWEGSGLGLDAWAVSATARPAAFHRDTASVDGVVWPCHGAVPNGDDLRRWETTGRKDSAGRYLSLGGLFPGWEGGRGGYDCEPLARLFGPRGERWGIFVSYSLGRSPARAPAVSASPPSAGATTHARPT